MLELTLRGSFPDLHTLAGFLTQLVHAGIRPDLVDAESNEPTGSITQPMQPQPPMFNTGASAVNAPIPEAKPPKRRGRPPAAAVLDQPQAAAATGPFGNGAAQPAPAAPAQPGFAFAPAAPAAPAPVAVTPEMLQAKLTELIANGKMQAVVDTMKLFGAARVQDVALARYGDLYAALSAL
jgi:hypothetical protein